MVGREQLAHPQGVVRDVPGEAAEVLALCRLRGTQQLGERVDAGELVPVAVVLDPDGAHHGSDPGHDERSEEHTSELQSRGHLVCRLLLEKKKKINSRERSTMFMN